MYKNLMDNPSETITKKLLRGSEAAEILNCSAAYVFQMIRQGELPGVRLGRSVRVRQEDLDEFIASGGTKKGGRNA
jgi:excisionase family DNA binding protein